MRCHGIKCQESSVRRARARTSIKASRILLMVRFTLESIMKIQRLKNSEIMMICKEVTKQEAARGINSINTSTILEQELRE